MTNILIATKNMHKATELAAMINKLTEAVGLAEWEKQERVVVEPEENGKTFLANAHIKARHYAQATGLPALADDSGLTVLALGRAPGVHSARYGGLGLNDQQRCQKLLQAMKNRHDRRAFFSTVLVLARPDGACLSWRGRLDGRITFAPSGKNGFGYDPIFFLPEVSKTLGQITPEQKNELSHRARAIHLFQKDLSLVKTFLGL